MARPAAIRPIPLEIVESEATLALAVFVNKKTVAKRNTLKNVMQLVSIVLLKRPLLCSPTK